MKKPKNYIQNKRFQRQLMELGHNPTLIEYGYERCYLERCTSELCSMKYYICPNCHINGTKLIINACDNYGHYGLANISDILFYEFDLYYTDPSFKMYEDMIFDSFDVSCKEVLSVYNCISALRAFE